MVAQLLPVPTHADHSIPAPAGPPTRLPRATAYRAELIEQHLPLVHYVARRLASVAQRSAVVDYDDLVGYGVEGLVYAIEHFDPSRGVKFSTFAILHIRTTILDALRALDPVAPAMRRRGFQIEQTYTDLAQQHGTWPADGEVATALDLSVAQVRRCRQQTSRTSVSLDLVNEDRADGTGHSLLDSLADPDPAVNPATVVDQVALRRLLAQALATLPERDRGVLVAHYLEGERLWEIGQRLGISESRVSQLCARALKRLRVYLAEALDLSEGESAVA